MDKDKIEVCGNCKSFSSFRTEYEDAFEPDDYGWCYNDKRKISECERRCVCISDEACEEFEIKGE